jgi:hypothetical protein
MMFVNNGVIFISYEMSSLRELLHGMSQIGNMATTKTSILARDLRKTQHMFKSAESIEQAAIINAKASKIARDIANTKQMSEEMQAKQAGVINEKITAIINNTEDAEKLEPIQINNIGKIIEEYFQKVVVPGINRVCGDINAYSVDELKQNMNILISNLEFTLDDYVDFVRKQVSYMMNDVMCHVLQSIQSKYNDIAEKKVEDVSRIDWNAFSKSANAIDMMDTANNDIASIEIQEAIEAKVIGYEPKLMQADLMTLDIPVLIGIRELYAKYYSESFELSPDYARLMEARKNQPQTEQPTEDASTDDVKQTPREKELVERLKLDLSKIEPGKEDVKCHKRIATSIMAGSFDLAKEVEMMKKRIEEAEKQRQEMEKQQAEQEAKPVEKPAEQ